MLALLAGGLIPVDVPLPEPIPTVVLLAPEVLPAVGLLPPFPSVVFGA
jgi:hypothetical protein